MTSLLRAQSGVPTHEAAGASSPLPIHTLREAWLNAADLAQEHNVPGLHDVVERRLARLSNDERYDEKSLLAVAEECQAMVAVATSEVNAAMVGRRLRRGVYEFLLACDARAEQEQPAAPVTPEAPPRFALVGMATVRAVVGTHLAKGRYHEAAAVLSRVSRNQRGTELAEIACSAGVACRAARQRSAAAACFQAAVAADPEYSGAEAESDDIIG